MSSEPVSRTTKKVAEAMHSAEQELAWIQGLRDGNLEVYHSIFKHFTPALWRFARLSVPEDVAEDIVQDIMFDVWNRRETLEIRGGLAVYFFRAVRNKVITHSRHSAVVRSTENELTYIRRPGMGELPPAPDNNVIVSELQAALTGAFHELPHIQREVLMLRWMEEMSYEEIASALSISLAAAQQNGSRAQRTIRALLGRFLDRSE